MLMSAKVHAVAAVLILLAFSSWSNYEEDSDCSFDDTAFHESVP